MNSSNLMLQTLSFHLFFALFLLFIYQTWMKHPNDPVYLRTPHWLNKAVELLYPASTLTTELC